MVIKMLYFVVFLVERRGGIMFYDFRNFRFRSIGWICFRRVIGIVVFIFLFLFLKGFF